ncbi:zf-CCHC domain-containing protein [Tanacetum coccineum]
MSTQQDIYVAGSENRPPMLKKDNYVPWSSRLLRYAKSKPNGKLLVNSIKNGPYVRRMIHEPSDPNSVPHVAKSTHDQTNNKLTEKEVKQMEADDQAIQGILMGLQEDIYAAVDSYDTAYEIWLRVKQMMKGSSIRVQEKKAKLFNEWEMYTSTEGESTKSYYHRVDAIRAERLARTHDPFALMIAQPSMTMGQERQIQLVGGNGGNQFGQYARQIVGNQNGYNAVQNVRNQTGNANVVAARARGNGNQIRDMDEIEKVNENYILMANLQQASTSGTQTDKAPVYDSDGSTKKVNMVNRKMKEANADLTTELARYKGQEKSFEINKAKFDELETGYRKSVYQEQCLTKKINALHLSFSKQITTLNEEIGNLNNQLSKEKSTISLLQEEKKKLKSDFKTREDELLDKQIQYEKKIMELDKILVKMGLITRRQNLSQLHLTDPAKPKDESSLNRSMDSDRYLEGQSMQRPPLFEIARNKDTQVSEVVPFKQQDDDLKRKLAKSNEAKMVLYNALPKKEYERVFMCKTAKDIWQSLSITHQGNIHVKDNKIDVLVQQYEQFTILEEESIDSGLARFNTIITSLKALDEGFSSKNHVKKFLRALHPKWRVKVTTIEESKDLSLLALDELIGNLKVHEVVMEKDFEIYRGKKESVKSIALKGKKESSDEETLTFESDDEEYVMAVRNFKKFFRRKGKFVRQPREEKKSFRQRDEKKGKSDRNCFRCGDLNHLIGDCPKPPRNKDQKAFIRGSWSDSENESRTKIMMKLVSWLNRQMR